MDPVAPTERTVTLPSGVPELTLGWEAIHWASKYLRQPDGENAGERWSFIDSQAMFLLHWYALNDDAGWIFNHGVRRWAKGAGKSPFSAVLSLIEFLAPVRFGGWCENDGLCVGCRSGAECVGVWGRRVGMPLVQIAATAADQANVNTMRMVRALVPPKSRIKRDFDLDTGKTIFHAPGGGQLMIITSSPTTEEGALMTFGVLDQTESFTPSNGGTELARVVDRNAAKSGNRILETSNAWEPGKDSVAENTFDAWVAQEEGRLKGESKILYDARMAPPDVDWDEPDSILRAIDYTYGDCHWVNRKAILEAVLSPRTPIDVSKRFYLNWPTAAEDAWVTPQQWAAMAEPSHYIPDGAPITIGFDGSRVNDATALIGCEIETGFVFEIGIWETDNGRNQIPVWEVDAAMDMAYERWDVWADFSDVKEWEEHTKISWREKFGERVRVWAVPGGRDPQPIAWDMRTHVAEFTQACEMVQQEIESGAFRHDGSSALARHVVNARRKPNRWGVSIGKEAPKSAKKIDGDVAMIIARHARRLVLSSPAWKERKENEGRPSKGGRIWSWS